MNKIEILSFEEKSLFFAELSKIAYKTADDATLDAQKLGFNTIKFYDKNGSQAFLFVNEYDIVISCRGTQPNEKDDIIADLQFFPKNGIHRGFNNYVNNIWDELFSDICKKDNLNKNLWITGHSLGAGMATIIASRCSQVDKLKLKELYTYGSPRVGLRCFVYKLKIPHYRWRNNNDVVTLIPPFFWGYIHHGTECYFDKNGNYVKFSFFQKIIDWFYGIKTICDPVADHDISEYIKHLKKHKDL